MIAIYEDHGGDYDPDDYEPVALYDDGEWLAGGDEWEPYYPTGTPEDAIKAQLDGPSPVVVEVTEGADDLKEQIAKADADDAEAEADRQLTFEELIDE